MAHVTIKAFKSAAAKKTPAIDRQDTLRKAFMGKALEAGERTIKFTISTNSVDLDNDTVNQEGWDLSVFMTNPCVLWMHDSMQVPVGKCVAIGVEDGALKAAVEFIPESVPVYGPISEGIYQMCRLGFLSATSVGFLPTAFEIAADRTDEDSWLPAINFTQQKLLEFSIVTIPANSDALIEPGQRIAPIVPEPQEAALALVAIASAAAARAAAEAKSDVDRIFRRARQLARIL